MHGWQRRRRAIEIKKKTKFSLDTMFVCVYRLCLIIEITYIHTPHTYMHKFLPKFFFYLFSKFYFCFKILSLKSFTSDRVYAINGFSSLLLSLGCLFCFFPDGPSISLQLPIRFYCTVSHFSKGRPSSPRSCLF